MRTTIFKRIFREARSAQKSCYIYIVTLCCCAYTPREETMPIELGTQEPSRQVKNEQHTHNTHIHKLSQVARSQSHRPSPTKKHMKDGLKGSKPRHLRPPPRNHSMTTNSRNESPTGGKRAHHSKRSAAPQPTKTREHDPFVFLKRIKMPHHHRHSPSPRRDKTGVSQRTEAPELPPRVLTP